MVTKGSVSFFVWRIKSMISSDGSHEASLAVIGCHSAIFQHISLQKSGWHDFRLTHLVCSFYMFEEEASWISQQL
jgi:hypothetical protein